MIISGQGGLPLLTGRSFKWLWLAWSASVAELSLTNALVRNGSYQRTLCIWFGSIPNVQVMMLMMMCQNTLIQWWKREATLQMRRTCALTYLRHIPRWGFGVKDNLTNVLASLLQIPAPTKYHYCFALLLDPRYFMDIKDIKTFHQSKNIDTKVLVHKMMPKLYEHIMAEEISWYP